MGLANIFVPFPGLELTRYAEENGYYDKSQGALPKDYFTCSVMNTYSKSDKGRIYKLMCLFPIFVNSPSLFRKLRRREALFRMPSVLLRILYEMVYTFKMSRMYVTKTPFWQKVRMGIRYIRNL